MASGDQDILAKISQLAGQINRHKNGQQDGEHTTLQNATRTQAYPHYPHANTAHHSSRRGYLSSRGRSRGGRAPQVHRHRTLVLNGGVSSDLSTGGDESEASGTQSTSGSTWVSKTDRHLQLINTSIFEKDRQVRARAIEETRQQKLRQRDERERTKFHKHIQHHVAGHASDSGSAHEIVVQGIRFRVAKNGSKLVKVPGDGNSAKSTPKTHMVGGVRFHRSKNGNLYRAGIIKAYRRKGFVKKIDEPCKIFTTTGSCPKGPRCRYIHDARKVAICKDFLQKGSCPSGDACDLSHELIPERTPTCLHFAKGNCSNPACRYTHVRVSPAAKVCRDFAIYGYCEKGSECQDRHVHECPEFSNNGTCTIKGCKLPHRYKASVMRNNTTGESVKAEDENSDISSDEEDEEIDSEDVDSDDLDEEFFGNDEGEKDMDIPTQQDFVQLR